MESETGTRLMERIKQLRVARGVTQEAFAEEAKISYKYYQAIEAGRKVDLRLSTLERLAHAHELEVWELLLPQARLQAVAEGPASSKTRRPAAKKRRKPGRK
jgi:transcriptional regulator with XRE-family HTH domain